MAALFVALGKPVWTRRITILMLIILAIGGIALILYTTEIGPWAYSDSTAYLKVAENIAAGRGVVLQDVQGNFNLYTWHPPLFSALLSIPATLNINVVTAARWLNALLFGLTIFVTGWATYWFSKSLLLSVGTSGLILFSLDPVKAYSGVMSEGLFILTGFLGLFLLSIGITQQAHRRKFLIFGGIMVGLATLTRYMGVAFIAAGGILVFAMTSGDLRHKINQLATFLLPGLLLSAVWLVPTFLTTHSVGYRKFILIDLIRISASTYIREVYSVIGSWLPFFYRGNHIVSPASKVILAMLIGLGLILFTVYVIRKRKMPINTNGLLIWAAGLVLFIISYIAIHLASYLFLQARPDINGRLLLPIFIGAVMLLAAVFSFIGQSLPQPWISGLCFVALVLLSLWYFHGKLQLYLFEMNHYGEGYTSKRWNEDPIFDQIAALDPNQPLCSNIPALVLFYTGRFPDNIEQGTMPMTYYLDIPADHGLVLFNFEGRTALGDDYADIVSTARERFRLYFEDNEGIVFLPR